MKWYSSKYALAFYVGVILGVFGAAQQAVQIVAKTNPELASILGAGLIGLALFVNVLPRPNDIVHPTQVNIESAPNMTQNVAAPPADPAPDPPPPLAHRTVYVPTRDAKGHYAKPPPLDIHADS